MSPKITPTITMLAMIVIAVLMIANNNLSITEAVDTTVSSDYCSEGHYVDGDPYGDILTELLQQMVDNTPNAYQYNYDLTGTIPETGENIYGHAKCSETLEPDECNQCLAAAGNHLLNACDLSIFAFVELVDCGMKYDDSPFQ